jgi:hypothetical protein
MKKIILFLSLLPGILVAQNITNTLGASGEFIVEDNSNKDVLYINPGSLFQEIVFGLQPAGFDPATDLPVGQFSFLSGSFPTVVNLITANGSNPANASFLELIRERGTLDNPGSATGGDALGIISFGAYDGSGYKTGLSSIKSKIVTATGANPNVFTTDLEFSTTGGTMTFDNGGNLIVPSDITANSFFGTGNIIAAGPIVSQKIITVSASTTLSLTDRVVLVNTGSVTITLPAGPPTAAAGVTYIIKNITGVGGSGGNITISGTNFFDGPVTLSNGEFATVIADGSGNWYLIGN